MMQRMKGTLRPGRKAGVLALAVLLLTCVLTAGAVSATDEEWHEVTTFEDLKSNLEDGNWTRLVDDITSPSGQIFLKNVNNARFDLNGHNLTMDVDDRSAIVIGNTSVSEKASLTVLDSTGGGKVNATNNYLFFVCNESTLTLESGRFEANYSAIAGNANGQYSNPTFTVKEGVELVSHGDVAVFLPAEGTKATITGATITGKLGGVSIAAGDITIQDTEISVVGSGTSLDDWTQGPNSDGSAIAIHKLSDSYKGDLTLTLLGTTSLSSENGVVFHNYISDDQSSLGKTEVTIADTVVLNGKITSATYGKNCKGDGGVFKDTNGNILLYPSLNQTGVQWTGDATNGYTLSITAPGSYKLMDDVTISSMTVSAENVVIDGNKDTCTLTLLGTKGQQGVITVDNGATLKNLNVVAEEGATFGTAIKVKDGSLTDSTIDLTNQNAQSSSDGGRMSAIAVFVENGDISGNEILAGNSETSSSQCVVVSGSDVTVSGNTLTTGKSAAEWEGKQTSGSVGIRLSSGASETTTITNNHITSTQGAGLNNGIAADGVSGNVVIDASGNTFDLAATEYGGGAIYVNPKTDGTTVTLNANENTVVSAASFIYADNAEGATTYAISGEIENNDFAAADEGLVSADGLTPTLENLKQSGNSGLITDPSESLTVNPGESKITVTGAEVNQDGDNAIITFTGYKILITNATVSGSAITYKEDSTATVTHNTVSHMDSSTDIDVELLITDMSKLEEISTPKATIGDDEKAQLAAQKITPVSVVDIHHEGEPGFDQITLTISGLAPSGEIIGFHVGASGVDTSEVTTQDGNHVVTFTDLTSASPFGIGVISDEPQPTPVPPSGGSSGDGNMENAYRVLFNDGATTLSVVTDLSSGDKLTKPETPVKDGYTFAGWYKDSACTQGWDFETGISGDMTLYAKWTAAGSSGETEATATPTKTQTAVTTPQPTKTQTAAATTSAPQATTAAGVSPTLTQAPAPVAGALFGLLAAGVLLRRRFQ